MRRNDVAWKVIVWTLKHVATDVFAENCLTKLGLKTVAEEPPEKIRKYYPQGTVLKSKCRGCGKYFRQVIKNDEDTPAIYHTRDCQDSHRVELRDDTDVRCYYPHKVKYPSYEMAERFKGLLVKEDPGNYDNRVYRCTCKGFHLGRVEYEVVKEGEWAI